MDRPFGTQFSRYLNPVPDSLGPKKLRSEWKCLLDKAFVGHGGGVSGCLPLAVPIGLSPLLILTLCGSECVLVVSTGPPDDLSCLTTPGAGAGVVSRLNHRPHPRHHTAQHVVLVSLEH